MGSENQIVVTPQRMNCLGNTWSKKKKALINVTCDDDDDDDENDY